MPETWPFTPLRAVREELEWRTDVLAARDGEQRIALRALPRRYLAYQHILTGDDPALFYALMRANRAGDWTVSVWPRRSGLSAPPTETAQLAADPAAELMPSGALRVSVLFQAEAASETAATLPAHAGLPVLADASVVAGGLEEGIGQRVEYVDSGLGPVAVETVESYWRERRALRWVDVSESARLARRQMLYALRGRQAAFWAVPRRPRLRLTAPVGAADTTISVAASGAASALVGRSVAITWAGQSWYRTVTAASLSGGAHLLSVAALGADVPAAAGVCLMLTMRADADRITLEHLASHTVCEVPAVEVPE